MTSTESKVDFSIITPSLNYGQFLGECLESVAAQSGVKVEHLIIDGGSTDDSRKVAASFPHANWFQEPDEGMSDAINKGFDRARGEWVMWLNADDRLRPAALSALKPSLDASAADVVYGDWGIIDHDGRLIRELSVPRWSRFVHIHHHCYIASTAAFYRKATVIDEGIRLRNDFHYVMDGEFYARLDAKGKSFEHAPFTTAEFRLHGGNASKRNLGRSGDMENILAAERQHVESRAIRRAYGFTPFEDPYLNGLSDGVLWVAARVWKSILRVTA